jgi:hypothetical protein
VNAYHGYKFGDDRSRILNMGACVDGRFRLCSLAVVWVYEVSR